MFRHAGMVLALGSIFALGSAMPAAWAHGTTERVSVSSGGAQGNSSAATRRSRRTGASSPSARMPPTWCRATPTTVRDVFVRDRQTGTTRRVSVGSGGAQGNGHQLGGPAISADGRFVAFGSCATNLVPGDTNGCSDVFVRDRQTGTTQRVSVGPGGAQGNGFSVDPAISADGRFVAFESRATNLVPGDTNDVARHLRPRPPDGHDPSGSASAQAAPRAMATAQTRRSRRTGASSPSVGCHQPGAGRHQRRGRRVRPRPPDGHDPAGERRLGRRPGQ